MKMFSWLFLSSSKMSRISACKSNSKVPKTVWYQPRHPPTLFVLWQQHLRQTTRGHSIPEPRNSRTGWWHGLHFRSPGYSRLALPQIHSSVVHFQKQLTRPPEIQHCILQFPRARHLLSPDFFSCCRSKCSSIGWSPRCWGFWPAISGQSKVPVSYKLLMPFQASFVCFTCLWRNKYLDSLSVYEPRCLEMFFLALSIVWFAWYQTLHQTAASTLVSPSYNRHLIHFNGMNIRWNAIRRNAICRGWVMEIVSRTMVSDSLRWREPIETGINITEGSV